MLELFDPVGYLAGEITHGIAPEIHAVFRRHHPVGAKGTEIGVRRQERRDILRLVGGVDKRLGIGVIRQIGVAQHLQVRQHIMLDIMLRIGELRSETETGSDRVVQPYHRLGGVCQITEQIHLTAFAEDDIRSTAYEHIAFCTVETRVVACRNSLGAGDTASDTIGSPTVVGDIDILAQIGYDLVLVDRYHTQTETEFHIYADMLYRMNGSTVIEIALLGGEFLGHRTCLPCYRGL